MTNIFEYLDNLFFGPTLVFEASCRYSLDDAVNRLSAVVIPRFSLAGAFRQGLKGTVTPDRVKLRWKCAWRDNSFGPMFLGRFVSDANGVRLVGEIGVPSMHKILAILLLFVPPIFLLSYVGLGLIPAFAWPLILVPLPIVVVALYFSRMRRRREYQLIADTLDSTLS